MYYAIYTSNAYNSVEHKLDCKHAIIQLVLLVHTYNQYICDANTSKCKTSCNHELSVLL